MNEVYEMYEVSVRDNLNCEIYLLLGYGVRMANGGSNKPVTTRKLHGLVESKHVIAVSSPIQ